MSVGGEASFGRGFGSGDFVGSVDCILPARVILFSESYAGAHAKSARREGRSHMTRKEIAVGYFNEGYNCAQAVVLAFADKLPFGEDELKRIAAPFGGGMGRLREVCGAVSGMVLLAGLSREWDTLDRKSKNELYALERKLAEEFRDRAGAIVCRELLVSRPHGDVHNSQKPGCAELVGTAAEIVEENGLFG